MATSESSTGCQEPQGHLPFNIPASSGDNGLVTVRVIDTTTRINMEIGQMLQPKMPGHDHFCSPSYSFLVEHHSLGRKVLFDLGVQKDLENLDSEVIDMIKEFGWRIEVEKDVAGILEEHGVPTAGIEAIIWSHYHWDHLGDPSTFPESTAIIVGPGFTEEFFSDGKLIPDSSMKEEYFTGRQLRELSLPEFALNLAGFRAYDYFGDGSFYILDSPGHAIGHLSALARTTTGPDGFIFMGGDIASHAGEFRPSEHYSLPESIFPNPFEPLSARPCPAELIKEIHPEHRGDRPFYHLGVWPDGDVAADDLEQAKESLKKLQTYDVQVKQILVIIAHDETLLDVLDFFPKDANRWHEKGWGDKSRWMWLRDFHAAVKK